MGGVPCLHHGLAPGDLVGVVGQPDLDRAVRGERGATGGSGATRTSTCRCRAYRQGDDGCGTNLLLHRDSFRWRIGGYPRRSLLVAPAPEWRGVAVEARMTNSGADRSISAPAQPAR